MQEQERFLATLGMTSGWLDRHGRLSVFAAFPCYSWVLKSFHWGFNDSMRATLLLRRHALISFSRAMAARTLLCGSNQTSFVMLYFRVKPGMNLSLCWPTRFARLEVTPV